MGKTVLMQVDGFTPVIDEIVQDIGLMPAVVFGRVWRYCQMKDGVCSASLERIGGEIGVSRKTVQRYVKLLCESGYLIDTTPERRNRPHRYKDAGKVSVQGKLGVESGRTESPTKANRSDRESEWSDRESYLGRTESPMKIEEERTQDTLIDSQQMFGVLAEICDINWRTTTTSGPKGKGALNESEKILREAGVKPQDLKAFRKWWDRHDWRGQKGQSPTPAQVRQEWGAFEQYRESNKYSMKVGA